MKNRFISFLILGTGILILVWSMSCSSSGAGRSGRQADPAGEVIRINSNTNGSGQHFEIILIKGKSHNHPSFAIWLEDSSGNYLQDLFITRAIGQSIFSYGDKSGDSWKPGEVRRPAALPYWSHKRNVRESDGLYIPSAEHPIPDAYSGPTPKGSFSLDTRSDQRITGRVNILLEVNQTWDWNEYWSNNKYPDDKEYMTSCQPSLVYRATVDFDHPGGDFELTPVGHGHFSGKDGSLTSDLSTLTTALQIFSKVSVKVTGN